MRLTILPVILALCAVGMSSAPCVANQIQDPGQIDWPTCFFAPYLDATAWPTPRIDQIAQETGVKHFVMAFVTANMHDPDDYKPYWGGYTTYPVTDTGDDENAEWDFSYKFIESLNNLRAAGGDIVVSFGGEAGTPLAAKITDINVLATQYQFVIDTYHLKRIDFDVEGFWVADPDTIDRRATAIKILQDNNPDLRVWYTLPVLPSGLTHNGLNVLQLSLDAGVRLDGVNIMTMNYGNSAAPNPQGQMGEYAIQSANSLYDQLDNLFTSSGISMTEEDIWSIIGVTPMIGANYTQGEVFDLEDAQELLDFAEGKNLGMLSFWSTGRDHPPPAGQEGNVSISHSGIAQEDYAFSKLYVPFTVPEPATLSLLALGGIALARRRVWNGW